MPDLTENTTPDQMVNDPSSQLFASLADFYRDNGLISEAIAICQAGLESEPSNIDGRIVLAKCLLATKQYISARAEAVKVLSVQAENSEAKEILSRADSAIPEAHDSVLSPVTAHKEAIPAPGLPIRPEAEAASPETAAQKDKPAPEPVKLPKSPVQEIPSSLLPLISDRLEKQPVAPLKTEEKPAAQNEISKPPSEEVTEWQAGFGKIMNDLVQTPQVKACMLVDENGYAVADAVSRNGQSLSEDTAALSTNIFKTAYEALKKIKLGELERIVIESGDGKIFLRQAGRMVLLISADVSAKVGLVMVNSKRAAEQAEKLTPKGPAK